MKQTILILFLATLFFISCKKKKTGIQPQMNTITESVYASGSVKALNQYTVYATVNGILNKINIKTGDKIQEGQILFELDNTTASLNAENAKLTQALSQENYGNNSDKLKEAELGIKMAHDKMQLDESVYIRQKNLWEQNIGSKIDYEQKKLAYESSKTNYESLRSRYAQLKTQFQNDLKRSNINVAINQKQQNDFSIKSAVTGEVFDILKEKGDLISPQMPLAIIGKEAAYILELNISENDITKLKVGQPIIITMDSYKGETFEAIIDHIDPIMNERSRNFKVDALFTKAPPTLYPNLTVEANIIIQTKKNALIIPSEYLINGNTVLLEGDKKTAVKIGLRDYNNAEIIEGISKDDIIYKP